MARLYIINSGRKSYKIHDKEATMPKGLFSLQEVEEIVNEVVKKVVNEVSDDSHEEEPLLPVPRDVVSKELFPVDKEGIKHLQRWAEENDVLLPTVFNRDLDSSIADDDEASLLPTGFNRRTK